MHRPIVSFFFFNDTATTEIYTMFREWYKATTSHDPNSQQTALYTQFARAVLNKATSPIDDTRFGGTD